MDPELVKIIVGTIAAVSAVVGSWIASRATDKSRQTDRKAEQASNLIEGYDEFVTHLRARVDDLEASVENAYRKLRECQAECAECSRSLAEARVELQRLKRR